MAGNDILSRVQILLDANTANFEQGMKKAQDQSKTTFENIRSNANKFGTAVAGAAGVAITGLIAMAEAQAEQAKQIEIAASKAQTSTTEIQKYGIAARQVGIETEQLADIYKDFNEKLGEFITVGGGGAADFFEQVAIKTEGSAEGAMHLAKQMAELSGPEAMGLYIAKMEEANLSTDQMNFLMESMASESQMLLPLYKNNAEQIKLWGDAALRTGVILDEQGIQKAAEYRAQSELLKMQLEGMKTQLVQAVIPAFVDIADAFSTGDENARAMADAGEVLAGILRGVAAVGIGVYATINLVANSMAALTFETVQTLEAVDKAAEAKSAKWWQKLPGVKLFTASQIAIAGASNEDGTLAQMADKNARIVEDAANRINAVYDNTVSKAAAKMAELYKDTNNAQAAATKGTQDWTDKQNQASKAADELNKRLAEQEARLKEQAQLRQQISQQYLSTFQGFEFGQTDEINRVIKAGFSATEQAKYIDLVKKRFDAERAEYFKSLNLEFNQYRWTEQQKLAYSYEMDKEIALNDIKLNDEVREAKLQFLDEQYNYEMALIKKAEQAKIDAIRNGIVKQNAAAQASRTDSMAQLVMLPSEYEKWNLQNGMSSASGAAFGDYQAQINDINATGDNGRFLIDNEAERAALLLEAEEAYQQQKWAIQQEYALKERDLARAQLDSQLGTYQDMFGAMAGLAEAFGGEQSRAYRAMFAVEKAISVARSIIAIRTGIAQAAANPFPMNLVAMATVAAETAGIIGAIKDVQVPAAHGGLDYVPEETTYLLNKGERVVSPQQNRDLTGFLDSEKSRQNGDIVINNYSGERVTAERANDGKTYVTIGEARNMIKGAFQNLSNPNSYESKQIQRGFNTTVNRK